MPWPAIGDGEADGQRPEAGADGDGHRTAPISGTAGVGQKKSEMK